MEEFPKTDRVDIMLLLEGTFPYVRGGVSSWVDQVIRAFPEYRFGAVFLGSRPQDYGKIKYDLPGNLKHLEVFYLYGEGERPQARAHRGNDEKFEIIRRWHARFKNPDWHQEECELKDPDFYHSVNGLDYTQFRHSRNSWDFITEMFQGQCKDPSFLDYLWTVRSMHAPIWRLASIARGLIPAGLYHTVSTGYAGFLGALLNKKSARPLVLSEHGIYTKERRIDLLQSTWINDNRNALQKDPTEISYYRALWILFFETLGRICYGAADDIVALFEGARIRQVADGAPQERTRVIPNGIDISRFAPLCEKQKDVPAPVLTLLGRVVPIKDIKTFIRSIRILRNRMPEVQGWIVGPTEEDPAYAAECRALAESLEVGDRVHFMGFRDVTEILPETGLVVLSSISEGLPLVILESFAAGVPVVATDVGSCGQLVLGCGAEDEALGAAGAIVGINNPKALADAAFELLESSQRWQAARGAALARVEGFYTKERMIGAYRELYEKGVNGWPA